jgi:hypothetical protein
MGVKEPGQINDTGGNDRQMKYFLKSAQFGGP